MYKRQVISGTVKVKNGSTGTITDINGKYTLSFPSNDTLVFSYDCFLFVVFYGVFCMVFNISVL